MTAEELISLMGDQLAAQAEVIKAAEHVVDTVYGASVAELANAVTSWRTFKETHPTLVYDKTVTVEVHKSGGEG